MAHSYIVSRHRRAVAAALGLAIATVARAGTLDDIGVTALRSAQPSLVGTGVIVAQAEALVATNAWEVNPTQAGTANNIIYAEDSSGTVVTATGFPNNLGLESGHANTVGFFFYNSSSGVAPGLGAIYNYDANAFVNDVIFPHVWNTSAPFNFTVVNQSFIFGVDPTTPIIDQLYDNYIASFGTLIVTAVGNGGGIQSPATAYNVISVAAYGGSSSVGPTSDSFVPGRSKPDIAAPGTATSYSTPLVSGVTALLVQAGKMSTNQTESDARVIKAVLLNGAVKPVGWTHSSAAPLDVNTGAGIVNAFNSYNNLVAGQFPATSSSATASLNAPSPAVTSGPSVGTAGWNLTGITSSLNADKVDDYYLNLSSGGSLFTLSATLDWFRQYSMSIATNVPNAHPNSINNLDLTLLDASNNVVATSNSSIDNVEHLASIVLSPGKYDLQVTKHGGPMNSSQGITNTENYAVAWNAAPVPMIGNAITSNNGYLEFSQSRTVGAISGVNALQIDAGATLTVTGAVSAGSIVDNGMLKVGSLVVSTGSMKIAHSSAPRGSSALVIETSALSIAPGTSLDISDHDLLIHNGDYHAIYDYVSHAFAGGLWTATGLTTSETDATRNQATYLCVVSGREWLENIGGAFDGLPVNASDVLIKYTLIGDVNLDGRVDDGDLGIIFDFYNAGNSPPVSMFGGDANYDGLLNDGDLGFILNNYNPNSFVGQSLSLENILLKSNSNSMSAVPEPQSLFVALVAVWMLTARHPKNGFRFKNDVS